MIRLKWFDFGDRTATAAPESSATESMQTAAMPTDPNGKRVLIVDDDAVFVQATSMQLRAAGFQVIAAQDSAQAIETLRDNRVDAVLVDITFPPDVYNGGMGSWDGFQLMSWLRSLPSTKGARFIIVSNSDSPEYRSRAAKLGAAGYLPKPLHDETLLETISPAHETTICA